MSMRELIFRSMRKNIKMYYLYFFAMIFSISLYFIFSSLQNNKTIIAMGEASVDFATAFQVAGLLLISITIFFTIYATHIFIRRRSQEIGLYQLIGLSKAWVAGLLVVEHALLGLGALLIGILVGVLLSRLFLLLFMNIIGLEVISGLTFSTRAVVQTVLVFLCLLAVVSLQIIVVVYRKTILDLFQVNRRNEHSVRRPSNISAILGLLGFVLIGAGYYVSTIILDHTDMLLYLMVFVLVSTIFGTYLIFQTTISWVFYLYREKKNGHLGLYNSLSIASLMHRMKGHANSLTLITVLSAMTITMISLSYSLYYSTEDDVRLSMPFDFAVENMQEEAMKISDQLEVAQINYSHHQLEAIRFTGDWLAQDSILERNQIPILLFSAEKMSAAGIDVERPAKGEAIYHSNRAIIEGRDLTYPKMLHSETPNGPMRLKVKDYRLNNLMNYRFLGNQIVVSRETFEVVSQQLNESSHTEFLTYDVFQVLDPKDGPIASDIFMGNVDDDLFVTDFYTAYEESLHTYGIIIFIAGFLGFVFILSTGSIVYFKQMTEAEQEKSHYKTLRQLGFQVNDIMKGIVRKQLFVYLIPLGIGLVHAAFALNVGSVLMVTSMVTPILMSMTGYIVIYLMFTIFTIRYYRGIVEAAL